MGRTSQCLYQDESLRLAICTHVMDISNDIPETVVCFQPMLLFLAQDCLASSSNNRNYSD
jgi:hypothetical protein